MKLLAGQPAFGEVRRLTDGAGEPRIAASTVPARRHNDLPADFIQIPGFTIIGLDNSTRRHLQQEVPAVAAMPLAAGSWFTVLGPVEVAMPEMR